MPWPVATITWPTAITPRVQRSYGCQFNMLLISRSHEDENTDLIVTIVFELPPFLGDITRVFSRWDAVLQIRQRPVDAVFAAVQIGF